MEIEDGKIIRCTEDELYAYWLHKWSDFIDFDIYKARCIELGTEVEDAGTNESV